MKRAMERHEGARPGSSRSSCAGRDWHSAPFGKLQALPKDGKPVTSWKNRDEAFTDIARGIREAVSQLAAQPRSPRRRPARPRSRPLRRRGTGRRPGDPRADRVRAEPRRHGLLVAMIEGAASHVSRHGTVPEQAAELIRWAESSTGPGLAAIQEALANFR